MANVRSSNTFYMDTQYSAASDELATKSLRIIGFFMTATSANAICVLTDSGTKKFEYRLATSGTSVFLPIAQMGAPIIFGTSVRPTTLTNCTASAVIQESSG